MLPTLLASNEHRANSARIKKHWRAVVDVGENLWKESTKVQEST